MSERGPPRPPLYRETNVASDERWPRLTPERRGYIERMTVAEMSPIVAVQHISQLLDEVDALTEERDAALAAGAVEHEKALRTLLEDTYNLLMEACHDPLPRTDHDMDEEDRWYKCREEIEKRYTALAPPSPAPRASLESAADPTGYDAHAYHGFKEGPLPGCNVMYGDIPCGGSIEAHCHCGTGSHLPRAAELEILEPSGEDGER